MQRSDLEFLLPAVLRRGAGEDGPLGALLQVMEDMHAPVEDVLAALGDVFHPYRARDPFVPYLAAWLDVDRFLTPDPDGTPSLPTGTGRVRTLVAEAARLTRLRGTATGLLALLEAAVGVRGFELDEEVLDGRGDVRPFVMRLRLPAGTEPYLDLVRRIVESEKPAYVQCEIALPPPAGADASATSAGGPAPGGPP